MDILADAQRLEQYWQPRNITLQSDLNIINLVKSIQASDQVKWMSNEPKVFFDTATSLVSSYSPRFRLPMSINPDQEEKDRMNKAERLLIGIYRNLEARQGDLGESYWLRNLAYWTLLGWYAVFTIVTKDKKSGDIKFIADVWHPGTVYPEWDSGGLVTCTRSYEVDKITAMAMASEFYASGLEFEFFEPRSDERVKVINYWKNDRGKIYNAIVMRGEIVKPLTLQKNLTRIPIHTGAVGSPDRITPDWQERRGESIIAANRSMYDYENKMFSLMATILAETAYPNIVTHTSSGMPAVQTEQLKGYGEVIGLKLPDKIELLKHAATPAEANLLLTFIAQQKQKGSVPNVVYGNLPIELSGFAISQLMAAIRYKLGPYLTTMQNTMSRIFTDFLYQYRTGKFGKITLSTENPSDLKRGMTYIEEFAPEDVPDRIYVEVDLPISSRFDKTQQILNARQALSPPQLLSRETLWEQELDIQDTEMEKERIREDQVMSDPFIMQVEIIERLWARVENYKVTGKLGLANALEGYIKGLETKIGIREPQQPKSPGIPPEEMPPEMTKSPSSDQMGAMMGTPPGGLARRSQTPEERTASKSGLLLSPTGEKIL